MLKIFGVDARRISWKYAISSGRCRTNSNNNLTSDDDILSQARKTVCQNVRPSVYITFFCLGTATDDVLFLNKYCVFLLGSFVHTLVPYYTRHCSRPVFPLHHHLPCLLSANIIISYKRAHTHTHTHTHKYIHITIYV